MKKSILQKYQKFNSLTYIRDTACPSLIRKAEFLCICGNKVERRLGDVVSGKTKSCGCYRKKTASVLGKSCITHGLTKTRFHKIWNSMQGRCNRVSDKAYKNYGERGVKILWKSFLEFRDDMYENYLNHIALYGEKQTTIDRINGSLSYSKENCRWATYTEQANNRRNNILYKYNGENCKLLKLQKLSGLRRELIYHRVHILKWSVEKAVLTPLSLIHQGYAKKRDAYVRKHTNNVIESIIT